MRPPAPPECADPHIDLPPLTDESVALIAKGIAHPTRIWILQQFEDHEPLIAQDIVGGCEVAQSTLSGHLRILREAGILHATKDGPRIWYCLRRSVLRQFSAAIADLATESALAGVR
jgi:ArsR family transcriptional regulator